jgi:ABC-type sugar transport system permease subunit
MKINLPHKYPHYKFIGPAVFFSTMFWIIPTVVAIGISCTRCNGISWAHIKWAGFSNYIKLFNDRFFYISLQNNLLFVICAVTIIFFTALAIALIINLKPFGWRFFQTTFFIPIVISSVVIGLLFKLFLSPTTGIVNNIADFFGLESFKNIQWLGSKETATYSVMSVYIWRELGFSILLFGAGLQAVPKDLVEAAKIDGASVLATIRYITVPLIKNISIVVIILAVTNAFLMFDLVYAMTMGGPYHASEVLSTYMYHHGFARGQISYGTSIAIILFVIVIIITAIQLLIAKLLDK